MFHVILYQPEIPPNTGNIIRLCANTGAHLHLVKPLGFALDNRELRRAGLDYHEYAELSVYENIEACLVQFNPARLFALSTRGTKSYADANFLAGDAFILGPETRGLPAEFLANLPVEQVLRLPLRPGNRSLNLANAAAVVLYEAWRQNNFVDGG